MDCSPSFTLRHFAREGGNPADPRVKHEDDELPVVFTSFFAFSDGSHPKLSTWMSLDRQITLIYDYLILTNETQTVQKALMDDMSKRPEKTIPFFLAAIINRQ